jgi:hypothetical protein
VLFSGASGDGIEMVQALDEAHVVDIIVARHPDNQVKAFPAFSIEGMNKHPLLFSWLKSLYGRAISGQAGWASEH